MDNFSNYKKFTENLNSLLIQQNILVQVIHQIASLKYILYRGSIDISYYYEKFKKALANSSNVRNTVSSFQENSIKALHVDLDKKRYKKDYLLKEIFQPAIGLINNDWNYEKLDEILLNKIIEQKSQKLCEPKTIDVYEHDTKILIHNGKVYYSPNIIKR